DLYRQQHSAYPGAVAATAATCPTGTNVTGTIGADSFEKQLRNYTNSAGQACTGSSPAFKYGPYLKDPLPVNPLGDPGVSTVTVVTTGTLGLTSTGTTEGWLFDSKTGEFVGDH
ncbi:MAG: hypothetical protein KJO76_01705, partial [Gammaproteobacteria bacterium]|nr:hypothetical protein [Gammaproteobacteria bacterium]